MTNAMKKKRRELLTKISWTTGDVMSFFGYSKNKASNIILKLREDKNNIPDAYKDAKRPPILVDKVLQALGTTLEQELGKMR